MQAGLNHGLVKYWWPVKLCLLWVNFNLQTLDTASGVFGEKIYSLAHTSTSSSTLTRSLQTAARLESGNYSSMLNSDRRQACYTVPHVDRHVLHQVALWVENLRIVDVLLHSDGASIQLETGKIFLNISSVQKNNFSQWFQEATGWVICKVPALTADAITIIDVLWHSCLDLALILNLVRSVTFISTVFPSSSQPHRIFQGNFSPETLDVFLQRKQIWNLLKLKCYTFSLNSYVFRRF